MFTPVFLRSEGRLRPRARVIVMALLALLVGLGLAPLAPAAQAAPPVLSYVAGAATSGARAAHVVRVPNAVEAGDTLVAFLNTNALGGTTTGPVGWTQLAARDGSTSRGRVWTKQATAADGGRDITARTATTVKSTFSVVAYRSTGGASSVTAAVLTGSNVGARSHVAQSVAVRDAGSTIIRSWAGKGASVPTWTTGGVTRRVTSAGTGGGLTAAVVGDSSSVTASTGTSSATSSVSLNNTHVATVVVSPGVENTNTAPQAEFGHTCTGLQCAFDATASTDADGDPLTFAWTFGDGSTATGASPSHVYATGGDKTVTLTVSDGSASATLTKTVAPGSTRSTPGHTAVVPEKVRTDMPRITAGDVWDIEVIGDRAFVVGNFTSIANNRPGNTTSYNQPGIAAYSLTTGLVDTSFRPSLGNDLEAVEASPDGSRLYVAGRFASVNGVAKRNVAQLDLSTGAAVAGFTANTDARAMALSVSDSTVYIGGRFAAVNNVPRRTLAAVDAVTGAVDAGFSNDITVGIGVDGGLTVQDMVLSHDLGTLVVVHTGRKVGGQDRTGVALIDTQTKSVTPWRSNLWDDNLQFVGGIQRAIAVDIAPDDSYFVVVSGSGGDRPPLNDTAMAFATDGGGTPGDARPMWISRAFDSIYSVAISEKAVYIGGHFSWNPSPSAPDPWPGQDDVGYGTGQGLSGYGLGDAVVSRLHLGALNPRDGKALEWNPYSNSDKGNMAFELTPRGLLTAGDATTQGGFNVGRLAFFDFTDRPPPNGVETTFDSPITGRVLPAAREFSLQGTASANAGIGRVQIEVQDADSRRYLQDDLTTWGGYNSILADLENPGGPASAWSLRLTVPGNVKMQAWARAFAVGGASSPVKASKRFETFGLDDTTPTTTISAPAAGLVTSRTFTMTGTAADDRGVTSLSVALRDGAGRYLQEDGTAEPTYYAARVLPDVVGATSSTWSYEVTVPSEGEWLAQVRPYDTAGNAALDSTERRWNVLESGQAPTVALTSPASQVPPTATAAITLPPSQPVTFSGSVNDDRAVAALDIYLINNSTGETLGTDGTFGLDKGSNYFRLRSNIGAASYNWSYTTPFSLSPGNYTFRARGTDEDGLSTPSSLLVGYSFNVQVAGDNPPKASLTRSGTQPAQSSLELPLDGAATDDRGVAEVRVALRDRDTARYLTPGGATTASYTTLPAALASPGATSTTWTLPVTLPGKGDWAVTAFAVDSVGQRDFSSSGATARYLVYPGDTAPTITEELLSPTDGGVFDQGRIYVSGRAEDDQNMAAVQVAVVNSAGRFLTSTGTFGTGESWRTAFLTSPGTPGSNFAYTTPVLPEGAYTVQVRGVDQNGLTTATPSTRRVTVTIPPGNTPPTARIAYGCDQNVCTFDARSSSDENPATLTYAWTYGTGQGAGTGPRPTKTFTAPGTFAVTLIARDEWGVSSDPVTVQVPITEPAANQAPVPVINTPSCANLTCNFSAVGSADPNLGDAVRYSWNFGDPASGSRNTATSASTSHAFTTAGTYAVSLTVSDGWGKTSTITRQVQVGSP